MAIDFQRQIGWTVDRLVCSSDFNSSELSLQLSSMMLHFGINYRSNPDMAEDLLASSEMVTWLPGIKQLIDSGQRVYIDDSQFVKWMSAIDELIEFSARISEVASKRPLSVHPPGYHGGGELSNIELYFRKLSSLWPTNHEITDWRRHLLFRWTASLLGGYVNTRLIYEKGNKSLIIAKYINFEESLLFRTFISESLRASDEDSDFFLSLEKSVSNCFVFRTLQDELMEIDRGGRDN